MAIETMRAWSSGTNHTPDTGLVARDETCYQRPGSKIPMVVGGSGARLRQPITAAATACSPSTAWGTVFVWLPDLAGPEELARLELVVTAFA